MRVTDFLAFAGRTGLFVVDSSGCDFPRAYTAVLPYIFSSRATLSLLDQCLSAIDADAMTKRQQSTADRGASQFSPPKTRKNFKFGRLIIELNSLCGFPRGSPKASFRTL